MRLFSWIATLAAATVLCGAGLASAANYTAKLTPVPESDEPDASGVAKVSGANRVYVWGGYYYEGNLTVTCRGLTPGAAYSTPAGKFVADVNGNGSAGVLRQYFPAHSVQMIRMERLDPLTSAYIQVLVGYLYFP
jgi:hypothetical protein